MEFGMAVGAQIPAVRRGMQIGVGGDGVAALVTGGRAVRVWTVMRGGIEARWTEVAAAAGFGVAAVPVGPGSAQTAKAAIDGDRASMTVAGCGDAVSRFAAVRQTIVSVTHSLVPLPLSAI